MWKSFVSLSKRVWLVGGLLRQLSIRFVYGQINFMRIFWTKKSFAFLEKICQFFYFILALLACEKKIYVWKNNCVTLNDSKSINHANNKKRDSMNTIEMSNQYFCIHVLSVINYSQSLMKFTALVIS